MKNIVLLIIGILLYKFLDLFFLGYQIIITCFSLLAVLFLYHLTKDTQPIRFIRMKKMLLEAWFNHFMWSPRFFLLSFYITSLFALVSDGSNKHMISLIDEIHTWWMKALIVVSTILWLPNLFALCISIGFYDESKEERDYKQKCESVLKWYTNKTK